MCGIAGIVGPAANEEVLLEMLCGFRHRGDIAHFGERFIASGNAIGTNRLAIVDPDHGQQPFSSNDGLTLCVFNGELYNCEESRTKLSTVYDFRTECDSEVVLAAYLNWGARMLDHLRGMFALAILDRRKPCPLLLARDPLGIKPLYFATYCDTTYFGSEIKAFQTLKFIDSIRSVGPGEVVFGDKAWRYYSVPQFNVSDDPPVQSCKGLAEALEVTVLAHLPNGTGAVACLLSGGIDSSTILYVASRLRSSVEAFTFANLDSTSDDLNSARLMCTHLGVPLHVVSPSAKDLQLFYLSQGVLMTETWEPPLVRNAVSYHFLCRAVAARGYKWCLSGEGADELFGGYDYFRQYEQAHQDAAVWSSLVNIHQTYLQMADRASMYATLEVRVPYMDRSFVDYCVALPRRMRICNETGKWGLRNLYPDIPESIRWRPKTGMNAGAGFGSNDPGKSIYYSAVVEHYQEYPDEYKHDWATCIPLMADFEVNQDDPEEIFNFSRFIKFGFARLGKRPRLQLNTSGLHNPCLHPCSTSAP